MKLEARTGDLICTAVGNRDNLWYRFTKKSHKMTVLSSQKKMFNSHTSEQTNQRDTEVEFMCPGLEFMNYIAEMQRI